MLFKNRLYIFDEQNIRQKIFRFYYNDLLANHFKDIQTLNLLQFKFY